MPRETATLPMSRQGRNKILFVICLRSFITVHDNEQNLYVKFEMYTNKGYKNINMKLLSLAIFPAPARLYPPGFLIFWNSILCLGEWISYVTHFLFHKLCPRTLLKCIRIENYTYHQHLHSIILFLFLMKIVSNPICKMFKFTEVNC